MCIRDSPKHDHGRFPLRLHITDMENELPDNLFFRCQKSFIVNLRQIASICRYETTLKNGYVYKRQF